MTKIGSRTVIHSTTVLVRDEENADISFSVDNWAIKLIISFHPEERLEQSAEWAVENDAMRLRLYRWINPLGTTLAQPTYIGKSPTGKPIELILYQHHIGDFNRVDLQFMMKD